MTKTDFFHQALIAIAATGFKDYPEYNRELDPYYELSDDERERYDPSDRDLDSPSPSKQLAWVQRCTWAAAALTRFVDRFWQTFDDSDPRSRFF